MNGSDRGGRKDWQRASKHGRRAGGVAVVVALTYLHTYSRESLPFEIQICPDYLLLHMPPTYAKTISDTLMDTK